RIPTCEWIFALPLLWGQSMMLPNSEQRVCAVTRPKREVPRGEVEVVMQHLKLLVPTYFANRKPVARSMPPIQDVCIRPAQSQTEGSIGIAPNRVEQSDFAAPLVPVVVHEADGVRIVLGS